MNGPQKKERDPEQLIFHAQKIEEYGSPGLSAQLGQLEIHPEYRQYLCGACGSQTTGRVLCDVQDKRARHGRRTLVPVRMRKMRTDNYRGKRRPDHDAIATSKEVQRRA